MDAASPSLRSVASATRTRLRIAAGLARSSGQPALAIASAESQRVPSRRARHKAASTARSAGRVDRSTGSPRGGAKPLAVSGYDEGVGGRSHAFEGAEKQGVCVEKVLPVVRGTPRWRLDRASAACRFGEQDGAGRGVGGAAGVGDEDKALEGIDEADVVAIARMNREAPSAGDRFACRFAPVVVGTERAEVGVGVGQHCGAVGRGEPLDGAVEFARGEIIVPLLAVEYREFDAKDAFVGPVAGLAERAQGRRRTGHPANAKRRRRRQRFARKPRTIAIETGLRSARCRELARA